MREGQLPCDMAEEQGKILRDLTNELMDPYDMALAEAVDQGYFTESVATGRLQQLQQRIEPCLAGVFWDRSPWIQTGSEAIVRLLAMTQERLRIELRLGKSVIRLAERAGVELEALSEALQEARSDAVELAVSNGRITQTRAGQIRTVTRRRAELCLTGSGRAVGHAGYPAPR